MAKKNKHGSPARRNKPYKAKAAGQIGGLVAIDAIAGDGQARLLIAPDNQELRPSDIAKVDTQYWLAVDDLKRGSARKSSWSRVATAVNMTLGLCETGFGREHLPLVLPALEGVHRAQLRGAKTGKYRFDGPGIAALTEVLKVHDAQLALATTKDLLAAEKLLADRIRLGHAYDQHAQTAAD